MIVLGLDLGNAKLKMCVIHYKGSLAESKVAWKTVPMPFSEDRQKDFEKGLPLQLNLFCMLHDVRISQVDAVVVCSSNSFSYTPYHDSIPHLCQMLVKIFKTRPVFLVSAFGQLSPVRVVEKLPPKGLYPYLLSNFVGSAYLGSKLIKNGLAIDIGTTTTDIIPIIDGQMDPVGLSQSENYLDFRYSNYRINWYGLTHTPLSALAQIVQLKSGKSYQVVNRDYRTDAVIALLSDINEDLITQHAYMQQFPGKARGKRFLAEFIGLDPSMVEDEVILEVRDFLYKRLVGFIGRAIQQVLAQSFEGKTAGLEVAIFALGEQILARPAVTSAGFKPDQIKTLQFGRETDLWSASSAFAMAILALEYVLETTVDLT